jgi:hypothetical protein
VLPEVNSDGTAVANETNLRWWYQEMLNRDEKELSRFEDHHNSSEQMFSLWFYHWMINHESLVEEDVDHRLAVDGLTYLAERVFELPYHELKLNFSENDIFGEKFGNKGLLDMCRDAVDLRENAKQPLERVLHDGLGMWNLLHLLPTMKIGEVAMIVSPPDPDDPTMGEYNQIYLYEKVGEQRIRLGIITDHNNSLEEWQHKARDYAKYDISFTEYDHLKFVAHPFIVNDSLSELKNQILLNSEDKQIPQWALNQLNQIVPEVRKALFEGNVKRAEELFNAFKIATTSKLLDVNKTINMVQLVDDNEYFSHVSVWYLRNGGDKYLNKATGCSMDRINLDKNDLFNSQWDKFTRFDMDPMSSILGDSKSESSTELSDGETACYPCPLCGGEVKRQGSELVCQKNPEQHHIKYQSQAE